MSLGGHATWLALTHGSSAPLPRPASHPLTPRRARAEPRLTLGIPIIGSPSILTLLSHRATTLPAPLGPLPLSAPYFPPSLLALIARDDPVNVDRAVWRGRKVCVLSGGADTLVNYVHGGSERFVSVLRGQEGVGESPGVVDVWVHEGW